MSGDPRCQACTSIMILDVAPADSVRQLGISLVRVDGYVLPFELASVLLLAALIGAIFVARPPEPGAEGGEE